MSWDEIVRVVCYAELFPGFAYLSIVARNQQAHVRSAIYACLSVFFFLLLVGLVLLNSGMYIYGLLHLNTMIVFVLGVLVGRKVLGYARAAFMARRLEAQ